MLLYTNLVMSLNTIVFIDEKLSEDTIGLKSRIESQSQGSQPWSWSRLCSTRFCFQPAPITQHSSNPIINCPS